MALSNEVKLGLQARHLSGSHGMAAALAVADVTSDYSNGWTNRTLDQALTGTVANLDGLQSSVDTIEASVGLSGAGAVQAWSSTNFLRDSDETSFKLAIERLDARSKGYTDEQITALINSAPGALDTLNELAEALNDDASFHTTITNLVSGVSGTVDRHEAAFGAVINSDGNYVAHSGTDYIDANASLTADLIDLDAAIKDREDAIDVVEASVGLSQAGALTLTGNFVTDLGGSGAASSIKGAIVGVDGQVNQNKTDIASNDTDISNLSARFDDAFEAQDPAGTGVANTYKLKFGSSGAPSIRLVTDGSGHVDVYFEVV